MFHPLRGDVPIWLHGQAVCINRQEMPSCHPLLFGADKNRGLFVSSEFYHLAGPADPNAPQQQPQHINAPHSSCSVCVCVCVQLFACGVWMAAFRRMCSCIVSWVFWGDSPWKYAHIKLKDDSTVERGLLLVCASFQSSVCSTGYFSCKMSLVLLFIPVLLQTKLNYRNAKQSPYVQWRI